MRSYPGLDICKSLLSGGDATQDLCGLVRSYPVKRVVIQLEKNVGALKRGPLVPIEKRVVPDDAEYHVSGLEGEVALFDSRLGNAPRLLQTETKVAQTQHPYLVALHNLLVDVSSVLKVDVSQAGPRFLPRPDVFLPIRTDEGFEVRDGGILSLGHVKL